ILCCLLFPMALGPQWHWSWPLKAMLIAIVPLAGLMALNARKKEREGAHPLIPPRLLQLGSIRFGVLIAVLFFSVWSGFMFCMALTMQTGLGMAPWQSGNSFIALGVTYFVSAWFAPRLIARYSTSTILLTGLAIQITGLLALIATFRYWGMANTALTLAPATGLVGYGQALIVNSFYRIGMRDIQPDDAGAASAILSTLQQAALGLGPALFGAILLHALHNHHGDYAQAINVFLVVETVMMLVLALATLRLRHRLCLPVVKTCQAVK
ncbi:MAG: MFS transporter, partial [Leclercia adecarboxylata]|nr:MFS transporter [Leclercia adecarboxylata]